MESMLNNAVVNEAVKYSTGQLLAIYFGIGLVISIIATFIIELTEWGTELDRDPPLYIPIIITSWPLVIVLGLIALIPFAIQWFVRFTIEKVEDAIERRRENR